MLTQQRRSKSRSQNTMMISTATKGGCQSSMSSINGKSTSRVTHERVSERTPLRKHDTKPSPFTQQCEGTATSLSSHQTFASFMRTRDIKPAVGGFLNESEKYRQQVLENITTNHPPPLELSYLNFTPNYEYQQSAATRGEYTTFSPNYMPYQNSNQLYNNPEVARRERPQIEIHKDEEDNLFHSSAVLSVKTPVMNNLMSQPFSAYENHTLA